MSESAKAYVREDLENGQVVIRIDDQQYHFDKVDAANLAVRILSTKTRQAPSWPRTPAYWVVVRPDLPGDNSRPTVSYDNYSGHVIVHIDASFHQAGYRKAQADIQTAIGI